MRWVTLLFLGLVVLGWAPRADACAAAPPEGVYVDVLAEDALIVWDEVRKIQHFVRRADFRARTDKAGASAEGFGFLVPTPTRPELAEAPDEVFARLEAQIRPRREERRRYEVLWSLCASTLRAGMDKASAGLDEGARVRVIGAQRVAGYDAVILEASDADALAEWLTDNGYHFRAALAGWLETYVSNGWKITAFKIAATNRDAPNEMASSSVRMSFTTDRPFFPYREPEDQRGGGARDLRVFFIAPWLARGAIGDGASWPGELVHGAQLGDVPALLAGVLDERAMPETAWLTYHLDRSSPRPGSDELFFARADEQKEIRIPPIVHEDVTAIPLFLDVIAFIGFLAFGVVKLVKRRRAA